MSKPSPQFESDRDFEDDGPSDFTPLTRAQAQTLQAQLPLLSPWRVLGVQAVVGCLLTLAAGWIFGGVAAMSAAFGALAVVVPGALFARGLTGKFASLNPGGAMLSFFLWELVKIVVTVAVLFTAYRVVEGLDWPVMLVSLVVTMKMYWLAARFGARRGPTK